MAVAKAERAASFERYAEHQRTDIEQQIDGVVAELSDEFGEKLGRDRVREQLMTDYRRFADSKVMTFVPILTERKARASLRQMSPT
jgi:hypothetical protein